MTRRILPGIVIACALGAGAGQAFASTDPAAEAARYNAQLGIAYLKQGKLEVARDKIERALSQNSRDAAVQTAAALLYDRLGDERRADRAYSTALRLDARNPDLQNNYAVFQCRRGEHAKGEKLFEQAAKNPLYRTPAVAYTNAGVCARSANDLARAEDYFRKALELQPMFPDALLQLADLAFARGNGLQARAFLERFFASTPATPDALALGMRVERALGDTAAANDYASRLKREFPSSSQARDLSAVQGG